MKSLLSGWYPANTSLKKLSDPLQPGFEYLQLLIFPKTKIIMQKETVNKIKENVMRQLILILKENLADYFEK